MINLSFLAECTRENCIFYVILIRILLIYFLLYYTDFFFLLNREMKMFHSLFLSENPLWHS